MQSLIANDIDSDIGRDLAVTRPPKRTTRGGSLCRQRQALGGKEILLNLMKKKKYNPVLVQRERKSLSGS
ncbi:MAG: hypothetical protein HC802_21455 [Caldilineaceae bacterium]|nr:hypothetical protein [Caldilineaceae bacterium]